MVVSEKRKEEKKYSIIEAAARAFAKKGFFGTVMVDIAAEAGIGKGTIYEYFDSKEDLFFAVFEWVTEKNSAAASVSVSALAGSASERLEIFTESIINSWAEMIQLYPLVLEFWSAMASPQMEGRFKQAFRQNYSNYRRIVSSLIREGIERSEFRADVEPESFATALVGTWDALLFQAWFESDFDLLHTARKYLTVIIRGLVSA